MFDRSFAVMFHHFWDSDHPRGQGAIDADAFESILQFIGVERLVSTREWQERAKSGQLKGWEVCLTFDDGLRCQRDIALPVLEHYGLSAFWFVYTGPLVGIPDKLETYRYYRTKFHDDIDSFYDAFSGALEELGEGENVRTATAAFDESSYLTEFPFYTRSDRWFRFVRDEILGPDRYRKVMDTMIAEVPGGETALAERLWMEPSDLRYLDESGHVVGLHSHSHPTRLERLPVAKQAAEYAENHRVLSEILGRPPTAMSHPCNSYDPDTLAILENLGITLGFRSNMSARAQFGRFEWPREDHANIMSRISELA